MGNSAQAVTVEENEAASAEALSVFQTLGVDADKGLNLAEWGAAFDVLDADGDGSISRKDWYIKQGTAVMFDAVPKKHPGSITKQDWDKAFESLDTDGDGKVSVEEWLKRRKVQLSFFPLGMGVHSWGVGVGEDFYEVTSLSRGATEMAVVGPRGVVALGEFVREEGGHERWVQAMQDAVRDGRRHESTLAGGEPRSRPQEVWESFEHAGWTARTDEQIEEWIGQWVEEHPSYRAIDAIGRECNEQTFALAFISWLTGQEYRRITDNTKGRALVYGGLALLAGVGVAVAANSMRKHAVPEQQDEAAA